MSLVESWPSTEMRSKARFTHTPVNRSAVSAVSAASVSTKQNMVANRGEIMPAALRLARKPNGARRAAPPRGRRAWASGPL